MLSLFSGISGKHIVYLQYSFWYAIHKFCGVLKHFSSDIQSKGYLFIIQLLNIQSCMLFIEIFNHPGCPIGAFFPPKRQLDFLASWAQRIWGPNVKVEVKEYVILSFLLPG